MYKKLKILIVTTFSAFLLGCHASTTFEGFIDPGYTNWKAKNILISLQNVNVGAQIKREKQIQEIINNRNLEINCYLSHELFPPTRKYESEERSNIIKKHNIDTVIFAYLVDVDSSTTYVPPTYSTSGSSYTIGSSTYYNASTTKTSGGYNITKLNMSLNVEAYNHQNGDMIWKGASYTGGNAFATSEDLFDSFWNKIIDEMISNSFITEKQSK